MSPIENAQLKLSRRDISAIAKNIQEETGLSRSKALDAIAKSAGFTGGNALMGSLKEAESNLVKPCKSGEEEGYLYEARICFISDELLPSDMSPAEIDYEIMDGGAIGGGTDIVRTPISKRDLGILATRYGSTPDFFSCLSEDDDDRPDPEDKYKFILNVSPRSE